MRQTLFWGAFTGAALTAAQGIDLVAVLNADLVPSPDIPVVYVTSAGAATATVSISTYIETKVASSIAAAISADPDNPNLNKRQAVTTTTTATSTGTSCVAQPTGYNYTSTPDTAAQFVADSFFASQANQAPVPAGYSKTFTNLNASNQAYGYLGYSTLKAYDPVLCAQKCDKIKGCQAVNLYFERDPSVNPDNAACSNPPSVTQIKCVFWGGPVTKWNALNKGQWRNKFQVVIAGSNGYVNNTIALPAGYDPPVDLGTNAIDAPKDCSGYDTFLGTKLFTSGVYDPNLCLAACTAQTQYNLANPPVKGRALTCQFFTTYLLYKNNLPVGQYCALYSKVWDKKYATNKGMTYGNDVYTIGSSYSFTNSTSSGDSYYPCDVASATSAIEKATLQPYCTTLLGYSASSTTVTATVTQPADSAATNLRRVKRALGSLPLERRAEQAVPSALATFPPYVVLSACSIEATPITSVVTATATVTVTAAATTQDAQTSSTAAVITAAPPTSNPLLPGGLNLGDFGAGLLSAFLNLGGS